MPVGPNLPYGSTIFCDDIREEVGGKRSLMGIYGGDMVIGEGPPATIPSLVAQITWLCSKDMFPEKLEFRIYRDSEEDREILFSAEIEPRNLPVPPDPVPDKHDPESPNFAIFMFMARFNNLEFTGPCRLRVRALVDGIEHRIGALNVRFGSIATDI
jgi:hypothetical protein